MNWPALISRLLRRCCHISQGDSLASCLRSAASLGLMACGGAGFAQPYSASSAGPNVFETGYEITTPTGTPSLYWVDNNRLLFAGIKTADMQAAIAVKEVDRIQQLKKLFVWNNATKSVRFYADAKGACIANGEIHYTVKVDKAGGKVIVRKGSLGSEKEIEKPLPSADEFSPRGQMLRIRSIFTCETHLRSALNPSPPTDRNVVVLREGDGYLDLGPKIGADLAKRQATPNNLTLYKAASGSAITLPMTWDENFSRFDIAYSAYRGAYVLRPQMPRESPIGIVRPWPKDEPLLVYLLWADGRTQKFAIAHWPAEYLGHPRPMKMGWIFGGGKSPKSVALYLFDGTSVAKVQSGFVREIAVSPDGCRAAVGINDRPYEMGTPISLKVYEFCVRR